MTEREQVCRDKLVSRLSEVLRTTDRPHCSSARHDVIAEYLVECLLAFDIAITAHDRSHSMAMEE